MAKRKKKKWITAGELMDQLARDPEYQREKAARDTRLRAEAEILSRAEAPLVKALRKAGAKNLESVWDLVNTRDRYPYLIETLLKHLDRDYPERIREGIARALAVPEARSGWTKLVRCYLQEPAKDPSGDLNELKWALHLALAAAADESVLDDVVSFAIDRRRHGECRSLFVEALSRMKSARAKAALEELRDDPDLADAFERPSGKRRR